MFFVGKAGGLAHYKALKTNKKLKGENIMVKYFKTGLDKRNAMEMRLEYDKKGGGYGVSIQIGERKDGMFGWFVDADYFKYFQKYQWKLLVPSSRRNSTKEAQATQMFESDALTYALEFADKVAMDGGARMAVIPY